MTVQCRLCRRIRDNGIYRLPWPGELPHHPTFTYCSECAKESIEALRDGKLPVHYRRHAGKRAAS